MPGIVHAQVCGPVCHHSESRQLPWNTDTIPYISEVWHPRGRYGGQNSLCVGRITRELLLTFSSWYTKVVTRKSDRWGKVLKVIFYSCYLVVGYNFDPSHGVSPTCLYKSSGYTIAWSGLILFCTHCHSVWLSKSFIALVEKYVRQLITIQLTYFPSCSLAGQFSCACRSSFLCLEYSSERLMTLLHFGIW